MIAQAMGYDKKLEEKRREYERVLEEKNLILEEVQKTQNKCES